MEFAPGFPAARYLELLRLVERASHEELQEARVWLAERRERALMGERE